MLNVSRDLTGISIILASIRLGLRTSIRLSSDIVLRDILIRAQKLHVNGNFQKGKFLKFQISV
jgi:hypothetical protein